MKFVAPAAALIMCLNFAVAPLSAAESESGRNATREQLRLLLDSAGKRDDVSIEFQQVTKQPYNFAGMMTDGLTHSEGLEVVISVTAHDTINFRVYPHYKGGYINVDKAKNSAGLMRRLLQFTDNNFLFWGIDDDNDVFSGYTITLESGFPEEAIVIVLRSIRNTDQFVGELRPLIEGTPPPSH